MKPRTVIVEVEIRNSLESLEDIKAFFEEFYMDTGEVSQVSVSVAQASKPKAKTKKGKVARKR